MGKLVTKEINCINNFISHSYDTIGTRYIPIHGNQNQIIPEHYSGNFWLVKGSYLKKLFENHTIGPYYDPEHFYLKRNQNIVICTNGFEIPTNEWRL